MSYKIAVRKQICDTKLDYKLVKLFQFLNYKVAAVWQF